MSLEKFSKHVLDPKLNRPVKIEKATPLARSPVVARIRKTEFGNSTNEPTGINVSQVEKNAASILSKAPKLQIHKI